MARTSVAAAETCNGYKIVLDERGAHVFDPRNPHGPALCRFATVEEARRWVRAVTGMAHPAT